MAALVEVFLRDLQEQGTVTSVLVSAGARVTCDQVLANIETTKVDLEARAPIAGTIRSVHIQVADTVSADKPLFAIEPAAETSVSAPAPPAEIPAAASLPIPIPAADPAPTAPPAPIPTPPALPAAPPYASPSLRRTAREWGVPLAEVQGTGRNQRILERDLKLYVQSALASPRSAPSHAATLDPAAFADLGPVELRPLSRVRKASARHVTESAATIPHVTQFDSADITELERLRVDFNRERSADDPKLTLLAFIIKACAHALRTFSEFNASLSGDSIILKGYVNIGFVTETDDGLFVPVLRHVDRLTIPEIARTVTELATKARERRLTPADTRGGCFTVSSLGGVAGTAFTPIINPPELAILGVSKHSLEAKWDGAAFQPRLMLPLSLSFDHRVIDGAAGARFVNHVSRLLTDLRRALF